MRPNSYRLSEGVCVSCRYMGTLEHIQSMVCLRGELVNDVNATLFLSPDDADIWADTRRVEPYGVCDNYNEGLSQMVGPNQPYRDPEEVNRYVDAEE